MSERPGMSYDDASVAALPTLALPDARFHLHSSVDYATPAEHERIAAPAYWPQHDTGHRRY
jgi:hypothetical protein